MKRLLRWEFPVIAISVIAFWVGTSDELYKFDSLSISIRVLLLCLFISIVCYLTKKLREPTKRIDQLLKKAACKNR